MAFGPNSTNPRERRAFADAKLAKLKRGESSYQEAYEAAFAASHSVKGKRSGYVERLGAAGVVLFDWSMSSTKRPGIIQYNFGGFVMSRSDAEKWAALGERVRDLVDRQNSQDLELTALHGEHNQRFRQGYESVMFTSIRKGTRGVGDNMYPSHNDIFNPLELDGVTPFIASNDVKAVEARISQLQ